MRSARDIFHLMVDSQNESWARLELGASCLQQGYRCPGTWTVLYCFPRELLGSGATGTIWGAGIEGSNVAM